MVKIKPAGLVASEGSPFSFGFGANIQYEGEVWRGESDKVTQKIDLKDAEYELEAKFMNEYFEDVKLKEGVKLGGPGELCEVFIGIGVNSFDLKLDLVERALKIGYTVYKKHLRIGSSKYGFDIDIKGVVEIYVQPNYLWPGWANAAKLVAREAAETARWVAGLFVEADSAGSAAAFTPLGSTGVLVGAVGGTIVWVGYGLYQVDQAHLKGRSKQIAYSFKEGYAKMLRDLTMDIKGSPEEMGMRGAGGQSGDDWQEFMKMKNWNEVYHQEGDRYKKELPRDMLLPGWKNPLYSIERAGKAAVLREAQAFYENVGIESWESFKEMYRKVFGSDPENRRLAFHKILSEQERNGGIVGICFSSLRP